MNISCIKQLAIPIFEKYGVSRASLFGSYARGENTEKSDVDILVEVSEDKNLFDMMDIQFALEDVLKKKIDLVEYKAIKPRLRPYILKDQIQIL